MRGPQRLVERLIALGEMSTKENGPLRFVTTEEINAGYTVVDGQDAQIPSAAKALLRPLETLEEFH